MNILFASNLKSLREERGMRQQELAEKLNTTQRKISYWENGKTQPDLEDLCRIAEFFEITVDELLGRID